MEILIVLRLILVYYAIGLLFCIGIAVPVALVVTPIVKKIWYKDKSPKKPAIQEETE